MAGKQLSFVIALKFLTENFNKGTNKVKASLVSLQRQFMALSAAVGAGSLGFTNLLSRMVDTAKETSRVTIALKNVSKSTEEFVASQQWLVGISKKYGVEINSLTSGYTKFKAAADIANMSIEDQRKIFESVSRAAVGFNLSSEDQRGVFMALAQMMSKGKVMAEELRLQMAERMPVALQAMAEATGRSVAELDKMMKEGKVLSADVLPKFADALNRMIPNVETDQLNASLARLKNAFTEIVTGLNVEGKFKGVVDKITGLLTSLAERATTVGNVIKIALFGALGKSLTSFASNLAKNFDQAVAKAEQAVNGSAKAQKRLADAEIAYKTATVNHAKAVEAQKALAQTATAEERMAVEALVAETEKTLNEKRTAQFKAAEAAKRSAAKATANDIHLAALKTETGWGRAMNIVKFSASRAAVALKSLFMSNIYTAAVSAVMGLAHWLYESVKNTYKLKNAAKSLADVEATEDMRELDKWYGLIHSSDTETRKGAIQKINELLGTQLETEEEITKAVEKRQKLWFAEAKARKAQEELDRANKNAAQKLEDYGPDAGAYKRASKLAAERQAEVDYWNSQVAKLSLSDIAENLNPNGGGGKNGKVEIPVVLKVEEIAAEQIEMPEFEQPEFILDKMPTTSKGGKNWGMSAAERAKMEYEEAKRYLDELYAYTEKTGQDLHNTINEQLEKVTTLEEAFKLAETLDALSAAQKELANAKYSVFEDSIEGVEGLVDAFARLNEVMEEDSSAWEKILAVFEVFKTTSESVVSLIESIQAAKKAEAAVNAATATENIAASQGEAIADATASGAKIPFPGNVAAIAAGIGAVMAAFASIPKFANGGIVGGNSPTGDKILARLNSGEGVLTRTGLGTLYNLMSGGGNMRISGEFKVKGRDLVAAIDQNNKFTNRTK
jgi:tape measure domain-containing protein